MKRSRDIFDHYPDPVTLTNYTHNKRPTLTDLRLDPMAKSKTYKKRKNTKRGKKKKRIPRTLQPRTKLIRVKASNYIPLNCTSGSLSYSAIQGNSCDDPYVGSGTGQPLGYDQWKTLYQGAYVLSSKVSYTVHNTSSECIVFGITPMNGPQGFSPLASYEHYREVSGTRSRILSPDVDHGYLSGATSTKKQLHRKNITDEDDLKLNLVTETQPTDMYYWNVWVQPIDQASTVNGIECIVDVEYIVLLTDPIIPTRSTES